MTISRCDDVYIDRYEGLTVFPFEGERPARGRYCGFPRVGPGPPSLADGASVDRRWARPAGLAGP